MKRFLNMVVGKRGALWNKLFRINKWKHYIPEAAQFNYRIYNKRRLASFKLEDIHFMILEMRRAELVHWLSMIPLLFLSKRLNIYYSLMFVM